MRKQHERDEPSSVFREFHGYPREVNFRENFATTFEELECDISSHCYRSFSGYFESLR